ncbi:STAS domain-containing protein [Dactylosporangium sp. NPDC000521]|uniref:STAS domain-containing protein n=1 Tax=Dactylosporangium sp. NPDC000521 TaxID=3363975 RepID=UPI0036B458DA
MRGLEITVTVRREDGVAHVAAAGDVDLFTAPAFRDALRHAATATSGPVEVDLSRVTFFSCAGAATLHDGALAGGGRLRLVETSAAVRRTIAALRRAGGSTEQPWC